MTSATARPDLLGRVSALAADWHATLCAVLPTEPEPLTVRVRPGPEHELVVQQRPADGVALTVDGHTVLRLRLTYRCGWDDSRRFVAVRWSSVAVHAEGTAEPLFRYDYGATTDDRIPAAHLNVHGHRDELVFAMMASGYRGRGRPRSANIRRGRVPRVATLHFPLGGHRFRPAFEDVVEMLVREFGLDVLPGWEQALRSGRRRWRDVQLRAAVRDDPAVAAEVLVRLGYEVTPPTSPPPTRAERITAA